MNERYRSPLMSVMILLVTGFLLTSLISYFVSRASIQREIVDNSLPLTSDNIYSEIQRDLLQPIFISSLMASDTFLRDWVISGEENIDQIERFLSEIKTRYNTLTSFFVSDVTNNYYYSGGILKRVSPQEPRDIWYYRVRNMDQEFEINVDPDMANLDTMTIFINYRVHDYAGNFIGATGVGLAVSSVKELLRDYQEQYHRNIFFVDQSGTITLHSSNYDPSSDTIRAMPGLSDVADTILESDALQNSLTYRLGLEKHYVNSRYIPEFDWHLIVEQTDTGAASLLRTLLINIAICLVITAFVLILTARSIQSFQHRIERLASTDKLTGLYTRRAFSLLFRELVQSSGKDPATFSIILLDFDGLKQINDTLGHPMGDKAIRRVSYVAKETIRTSDLICRWGGDEFLILLRDCDITHSSTIAEKVRDSVEHLLIGEPYETSAGDTELEESIEPSTKLEFRITVSLGVAQYQAGDTEESLVRRADKALYEAKQGGRNRVCIS